MNRSLIFIIISALVLASCKSSKHVGVKTPEQVVQTIQPDTTTVITPAEEGDASNFNARIHVNVELRGQNISTRGNLRMRKDEVIQISLLDPFLNITEVGRLEISPDNVLLINRIHNEYVIATYDELNTLAHISPALSFPLIQDYFWREAQRTDTDSFSYDIAGLSIDLRLSDKGSSTKWEPHTTPSSKYRQVGIQQLIQSLIQ